MSIVRQMQGDYGQLLDTSARHDDPREPTSIMSQYAFTAAYYTTKASSLATYMEAYRKYKSILNNFICIN